MSRHGALLPYQAFDFSGGLDVKRTSLGLSKLKEPNRLTQADNMVYTTEGGATKRRDTRKVNTTTLGAAVGITGGIQWVDATGTERILCGTTDGRVVKLNSNGTTTDLATGKTTGATVRWSFAIYSDLVLICNGLDAPMSWDGTTFQNLAGTPPATGEVVVIHANRAFMTARAVPSRLYWSKLNNVVDWTGATDAGNMDVNPNDGSTIKTLVPSIQELLILKQSRPYRLQGIGPATGYTVADHLRPTVGSIGCASTQGGAFALNDVWYLSESGVHRLEAVQQFGDLKESFVSERIEAYFRPGTAFSVSLNKIATTGILAYDSQWGRLYAALDTDNDGANDLVLVYDVALKAWSVWDLAIASMWTVRDVTTGERIVYAGGYDGFVRKLNQATGNANAIDGQVRHISNLGRGGAEKSPRYGYFYFTEEGNHLVTITTYFDFGATGGQSYTASLLGGSHTLGVNWVLGVDPLGSRSQVIKRVDLAGLGEYLEIAVRNQAADQDFTWLGYQIFSRIRRSIRRGTTTS